MLFDDDTRMLFCTNYDGEWDLHLRRHIVNIPSHSTDGSCT
ncbi:MAG TPA: hypothetical protein VFP27_14715 [Mycobacterium sp.]|nr:hypothetical protein [Mycobacterium sp.]